MAPFHFVAVDPVKFLPPCWIGYRRILNQILLGDNLNANHNLFTLQ